MFIQPTVFDYVAALRRICERDFTCKSPYVCPTCEGTGMATKYDPLTDEALLVNCPFGHKVPLKMQVRGISMSQITYGMLVYGVEA
jgi:hypothetical protein